MPPRPRRTISPRFRLRCFRFRSDNNSHRLAAVEGPKVKTPITSSSPRRLPSLRYLLFFPTAATADPRQLALIPSTMTPPTFWRRKSQRPPSPLPPSEREPLLAPSSSHPSSSGRPLSHASSNATIRIDYDHDQQRQSSQAEAGRERPGALLYRLIYSTDPRGNRSTPYLIILTLSLLGAQMAWSLELSYGTPYLLSLGLSPQVTSLVWLAGPLSGLIAQPVVGCLSDASNSEFRRRYYMLVSTLFILLSTLALAFAQPVSEALVDLFALGLGDWDPVREARVGTATRTLAVISFWILDFALNGLQASGRALVLDRLNGEEMDSGNAWLGRSESDEGSPRCH